MTARFSVFIPVWNDARWLPGAIESLLAQTHPDWELIIGDNASTEDIAGIVAGYADDRIRYHRWPDHVDYAGNANRTIGLCRFEWLQYLSPTTGCCRRASSGWRSRSRRRPRRGAASRWS